MRSLIRLRIPAVRPLQLSPAASSLIFASAGFLLVFASLAAHCASAQEITRIQVDASQQFAEPEVAAYDAGSAKSPAGSVLAVNSRYLTRDGKPWLAVMGEFHYTRYPRAQWEEELLKMKAAGVDIVATYVFWIHHEEIRGKFDWTGQRDLRAFAQLCAKHGMLLEPRIGPWAHGEVRNGGLPDWLIQQGPTRSNDPAYLAAVQTWYAEIGRQLAGLMWKDGGPVVAIQLENEYSARGPGLGEEHILRLKQMAVASGLDVPLYFVTGWDNAVIPARAVIPVYGGGYPDAPWDGSINKLPPAEVYAFRFQSRVAANMGAMNAAGAGDPQATPVHSLPYFTAEIGSGIEGKLDRNALDGREVDHRNGSVWPACLETREHLRSAVAKGDSSSVQVEGPDEICTRGNCNRLPRDLQSALRQANLELSSRPRGHRVSAHIVVQEDESGIAFGAHRRTRLGQIRRTLGQHAGSVHHHRRKVRTKVVEKVLKDLHLSERRALVPELTEGRLEIVGLDGKVVGVSGGLRLLQSGQLAIRILATLEHIGSIKVDA